jgi:hypothetical protein
MDPLAVLTCGLGAQRSGRTTLYLEVYPIAKHTD